MPVDARTYVADRFQLKLDGLETGFVKSVEGGAIYADVVSEPRAQSPSTKKHVGPPRYEPFELQIGLWMTRAVYDWIQASWQMTSVRKNGSIVAYDHNLEARTEREFFNALITEVTIPAMDGGSKDQCYMTVKLAPEMIRVKKTSGKAAPSPVKAAQEMWLPSNFRLEIAGLDCSRVSAIDSITVKQSVATDAIGEAREYTKRPGKVEFPNLSIALAESSAASWMDWFDDFVVKGNNGDDREKTGSLIFLSPNLQSELARINFFNLGIFRIAPGGGDGQDDRIRRVMANLYCERMEFQRPARG